MAEPWGDGFQSPVLVVESPEFRPVKGDHLLPVSGWKIPFNFCKDWLG